MFSNGYSVFIREFNDGRLAISTRLASSFSVLITVGQRQGRRSTAGRPSGVDGRLRPSRPGQHQSKPE
jgi:hypothetical protein